MSEEELIKLIEWWRFFARSVCRCKKVRAEWSDLLIVLFFFQSKHCLLDITPEEVERLNFAQLYPIVIFLKPPNKQMVK